MTSATIICHDCSKTYFLDNDDGQPAKVLEFLRFHAGDNLGVEVED